MLAFIFTRNQNMQYSGFIVTELLYIPDELTIYNERIKSYFDTYITRSVPFKC